MYFHNEDRVGVKHLRTWMENATNDKVIIVSIDGPTSFTRRETDDKYSNVSYFTFRDVCVNITRHKLVPKHQRVDACAVPNNVSLEHLPVLYTNDKVAQYYDFDSGDIIRITRTAGVQEPIYYYRIVREPA